MLSVSLKVSKALSLEIAVSCIFNNCLAYGRKFSPAVVSTTFLFVLINNGLPTLSSRCFILLVIVD